MTVKTCPVASQASVQISLKSPLSPLLVVNTVSSGQITHSHHVGFNCFNKVRHLQQASST